MISFTIHEYSHQSSPTGHRLRSKRKEFCFWLAFVTLTTSPFAIVRGQTDKTWDQKASAHCSAGSLAKFRIPSQLPLKLSADLVRLRDSVKQFHFQVTGNRSSLWKEMAKFSEPVLESLSTIQLDHLPSKMSFKVRLKDRLTAPVGEQTFEMAVHSGQWDRMNNAFELPFVNLTKFEIGQDGKVQVTPVAQDLGGFSFYNGLKLFQKANVNWIWVQASAHMNMALMLMSSNQSQAPQLDVLTLHRVPNRFDRAEVMKLSEWIVNLTDGSHAGDRHCPQVDYQFKMTWNDARLQLLIAQADQIFLWPTGRLDSYLLVVKWTRWTIVYNVRSNAKPVVSRKFVEVSTEQACKLTAQMFKKTISRSDWIEFRLPDLAYLDMGTIRPVQIFPNGRWIGCAPNDCQRSIFDLVYSGETPTVRMDNQIIVQYEQYKAFTIATVAGSDRSSSSADIPSWPGTADNLLDFISGCNLFTVPANRSDPNELNNLPCTSDVKQSMFKMEADKSTSVRPLPWHPLQMIGAMATWCSPDALFSVYGAVNQTLVWIRANRVYMQYMYRTDSSSSSDDVHRFQFQALFLSNVFESYDASHVELAFTVERRRVFLFDSENFYVYNWNERDNKFEQVAEQTRSLRLWFPSQYAFEFGPFLYVHWLGRFDVMRLNFDRPNLPEGYQLFGHFRSLNHSQDEDLLSIMTNHQNTHKQEFFQKELTRQKPILDILPYGRHLHPAVANNFIALIVPTFLVVSLLILLLSTLLLLLTFSLTVSRPKPSSKKMKKQSDPTIGLVPLKSKSMSTDFMCCDTKRPSHAPLTRSLSSTSAIDTSVSEFTSIKVKSFTRPTLKSTSGHLTEPSPILKYMLSKAKGQT